MTTIITPRNPLPVRSPHRFDITGLVVGGQVLCEDDFSGGMDGWVPLATPSPTVNSDGRGAVQWDSRGALGSGSIIARTVDKAGNSGGYFAVAMAIKRLSHLYGVGRHLVEFYFSVHNSYADLVRPKAFSLGLDVADPAGNRRFFSLDYVITADESGSPTPSWAWSAQATPGAIALGTFRAQTNENKDLPVYVAMEVDTATGKYRGIRINDTIRKGTLSATPDDSLAGFTTVADSLPTFSNGLNSFLQVTNRSNADKSAAEAKLHFHRLTYLGPSEG